MLVNKGKAVLRAPLSFFGVGVHSDFGIPVALNATGTSKGQPFWNASSIIPATGLLPKAKSELLQLRFKIANFQALPVDYQGDAVAMRVYVYQQKP
jgi:hypothetical protein